MPYDVIVVGTGPAGLTAGIYAGRAGLDTLFLEKESIGGELANRGEVRTYPGYPDGLSGTDLRSKLVTGVEKYDTDVRFAAATGLEPGGRDGDPHVVRAGEEAFLGAAVVLASGCSPERLDVPGEQQYRGRGVFYCAKCDGPLYRDETVAVAGSDDHAVTDALLLTEFAAEVVVLEPGRQLAADAHLIEEAVGNPDVRIERRSRIAELVGDGETLESIEVIDTSDGTARTLPVGGLYVHVGRDPNTGFLGPVVELTEDGRVRVDERMETSARGVFAAGDVRANSSGVIAAAVGDGATAIASAKEYLDGVG